MLQARALPLSCTTRLDIVCVPKTDAVFSIQHTPSRCSICKVLLALLRQATHLSALDGGQHRVPVLSALLVCPPAPRLPTQAGLALPDISPVFLGLPGDEPRPPLLGDCLSPMPIRPVMWCECSGLQAAAAEGMDAWTLEMNPLPVTLARFPRVLPISNFYSSPHDSFQAPSSV